jgi:hypothetical protein
VNGIVEFWNIGFSIHDSILPLFQSFQELS